MSFIRSGGGQWQGRYRAAARGFTLIELLVVLVIIGIILSFASLSIDSGGLDRRAEDEARRITALIKLFRQEGILKNQQLALRVFPDRYEFLRLEGEQWQVIEDDETFRTRKLPAELHFELEDMEVSREADDEEEEDGVMLFFLSSGESTPFEMHIKGDDDTDYILIGDALGELDARNSKDKDFAEWLAGSGR